MIKTLGIGPQQKIITSLKLSRITRLCGAFALLLLLSGPTTVLAYNVCADDGACTHEAMTRQALDIFFTDDPDFPASLRKEILFGAEDPDQTELFYGCGGVGGALITCSHLWDADLSLGTPFIFSPFGEDKTYPNALQASQALWTRALGSYAQGDVAKAYRYLGMIAHFLGDQTIPAHAHNDTHPAILGDADYFEVTMSEPTCIKPVFEFPGIPEYEEYLECMANFTGGPNAELNETETLSVFSDGILQPPDTITETERKFLWLFITTNQIADSFASDDYPGDRNSPDDTRSPFVWNWVNDELNEWRRTEITENELIMWGNCADDARQDGDEIDECPGMFDRIRELSYFRGIRALAGLFALWQESIKLPILKVTVVSMAEKEGGDDDTNLVDGTNDDDMYVGMVFGTNKKVYEQDCGAKGAPNYCEYQVATFLEDEDRVRRKIDGAFVQSNTTRRDADPYLFEDGYGDCKENLRDDMCFDAEGKDYINPLYRYGQVYDAGSDGTYDSGDQVEFRIYGWDADAESPAEQLGSADDLLDINDESGPSIIKFRVDLAKCFLNNGDGAGAVVIEGFTADNCGEIIRKEGRGGNNNDTIIYFNVGMENILDDDNDGVPNIMDDCPGTPDGTPVNQRGCPNREPVATEDSFIVLEDGLLNGNVITGDNGNGLDSDADGDSLSIAANSPATYGTVIIDSATGAFSYEPNDNYCGPDSFTYQLTDAPPLTAPAKFSNTATVSIAVSCVNDPPVVTAISLDMLELKSGQQIAPVTITVEDVDNTETTLLMSNFSQILEQVLTLTPLGCTVITTESPDQDGSTCTWVFAGRAVFDGQSTSQIAFTASDEDGPGSVIGEFLLTVIPVPIPTLSVWALLVLALLMLWGVGHRLGYLSRR